MHPLLFIAEPGIDQFSHRFGGTSWAVKIPPTSDPPAVLLLCLDLADPRLGLAGSDLDELPICCRMDGEWNRVEYRISRTQREVVFRGNPWHASVDPLDRLPPLPESPLRLRDATAEEIEESTAIELFVGGAAFIRIGHPPLLMNAISNPRCWCSGVTESIVSVGYEQYNLPSGLVSHSEAFFLGEFAMYFYRCTTCNGIITLSQPT